ncbi:hypothetical protein [Streptomonospora salina]|uniref:Uncharacterized protein n=1 Tax=Streptomonospora salina TaxID=104205 RepID=A0A841E842_9ACTN|nr:hypothetical protein [Streptomonospora salina]MBB6000117.1 hypothetical protein [Streptomonospora salina]
MRPSDISMASGHLAELRERGLGSLLVWHEEARRLRVTALTGGADDAEVLGFADIIIAGYRDLPETDDADALYRRWSARTQKRALQRGMSPTVAPLRVAMRRRGLHLASAPQVIGATGDGPPEIAEEYETDSGGATIAVTTALGYADPSHVLVFEDEADSVDPVHSVVIEVEQASLLQAADIVAGAAYATAHLM